MKDLGVLFVRLVVGVLLAGHGSQKLFGWFKGPGINLNLHVFTAWVKEIERV